MWVKFAKAYDEYAEGDIVEIDESTFKVLEKAKIVEKSDPPDDNAIINKAIEGLTEQIGKTIEAGITKGLEKLSNSLGEKIIFPNVTKDENEDMGGFKSADEFFSCVIKAGNNKGIDQRLVKAVTGHNEDSDTEGGFTVPKEISRQIWEFVTGPESLLGLTDRYTTNSNNLTIPTIPETSRKDGSREGGVLSYWLAEGAQYTASMTQFGQMAMKLHKLGVLTYLTEELLQDTGVNLGAILSRKAGNAINFKVNESFLWGTGAGQPQGVMRANCLITVPLETNQNTDTILHYNISKMYHRMHPRLRGGAVWYVHPNVMEQFEHITFNDQTSNVVPIYLPPGGLSASDYGTLKGRPVVPLEYMKDLGFKGDILFANFGQYATLTKSGGGITEASSIHVRFLFDETAFKWTFRVDGQALWPAALEDYNGTTTRSPFVTLADRSGDSSSSGI